MCNHNKNIDLTVHVRLNVARITKLHKVHKIFMGKKIASTEATQPAEEKRRKISGKRQEKERRTIFMYRIPDAVFNSLHGVRTVHLQLVPSKNRPECKKTINADISFKAVYRINFKHKATDLKDLLKDHAPVHVDLGECDFAFGRCSGFSALRISNNGIPQQKKSPKAAQKNRRQTEERKNKSKYRSDTELSSNGDDLNNLFSSTD
ncbi:hypothetical protein DdX_06783 [Ditylenchus destructor]|uniref:Uncharacterized protein n=1 Tax=Ditylenchus destructor TaxID=166010 RepID=A0AAD4N666_9BILA|nr:hypothetical protein DdX_06783 [Ditylenchus destructor]